MSRLPRSKRAQVASLLVEGWSIRSAAPVCDVAFQTVADLLDMAGKACRLYHDRHVRGIEAAVTSSAMRYGRSSMPNK